MKSHVRRLAPRLLLCLTALLGACTTTPPSPASPVLVAPGVRLTLPPPETLGRRIEAVQLVTARRDGETFVFEGRLSIAPDHLLLVGTDTLGRRAMTVEWRDRGIEVERAPWLPDGVRPENVLADIVLLFWPAEAVRSGLTGGEFVAADGSRAVRRSGEDIIGVASGPDPWTGVAKLTNVPWHYSIEVRSQVLNP